MTKQYAVSKYYQLVDEHTNYVAHYIKSRPDVDKADERRQCIAYLMGGLRFLTDLYPSLNSGDFTYIIRDVTNLIEDRIDSQI